MGKIAFVFAGQGSQHAGMGADLMETKEGGAVFDALEKIRPGTRRLCLEGTQEELTRTDNTQPCLFTVELAAAALLTAEGIRPDMAAGFSLGELSALCCCGAADPEEMFRIVCRRGELMQKASEEHPAGMAAVLKLDAETVGRLCASCASVYPVNYNCPGQTTVAAAKEQMDAFLEQVKQAGGRAVPLKVGGGFHSPFMAEAADAFAEFLADIPLREPRLPVYSNALALPYGPKVGELLMRQMVRPVRWEESVRAMISAGADTFIEVGPGRTLSGMIRRIDAGVHTFSVETAADAAAVIAALSGAGGEECRI